MFYVVENRDGDLQVTQLCVARGVLFSGRTRAECDEWIQRREFVADMKRMAWWSFGFCSGLVALALALSEVAMARGF